MESSGFWGEGGPMPALYRLWGHAASGDGQNLPPGHGRAVDLAAAAAPEIS
jgi:hypothetical protein